MYQSTKTFGHELGLSCCFRQWRADSHCNKLHGYAISVKLVFQAKELDHRNWVTDFGSFGEVKDFLKATFDHKTLVAADDPNLKTFKQLDAVHLIDMVIVDKVGCESFAKLIADQVQKLLPEQNLLSVEVREHGANSAIYYV